MDRKTLVEELKGKIIAALNLQNMTPADIADDTPLFEDSGLGLDSVDALELVVMAENSYGISIDDKEESKKIFSSVGALADFIIAAKK